MKLRPFVKIKHLSKRRTLVLDREIKLRLRRQLERERARAALEVAVAAGFQKLKIAADPNIDVDYVRGMAAVSMYGHDYRNGTGESVPEGSVHFRPDVALKLSNLDISDEGERDYSADVAREDGWLDILHGASCLRISEHGEQNIYDRIRNIVVSDRA